MVAVFVTFLDLKRNWENASDPIRTLTSKIISGGKPFGNIVRLLLSKKYIQDAVVDREEFAVKLCEHRLTQIPTTSPQFSWHMPEASLPSHPYVQNFLRGPYEAFEEEGFNGISHARNFVSKYCHGRCQNGYSMTGDYGGRGQNSWVKMRKTTAFFNDNVSRYKENMKERDLLLRLMGSNDQATVIDLTDSQE